jgi:hypothetical protein
MQYVRDLQRAAEDEDASGRSKAERPACYQTPKFAAIIGGGLCDRDRVGGLPDAGVPGRGLRVQLDGRNRLRGCEIAGVQWIAERGATLCPVAVCRPARCPLGNGIDETARGLHTAAETANQLVHLSATAPDIDRSYQLWLTRLPVRLGR